MRLHRLTALLVLLAVLSGCGNDSEPAEPTASPSESASESTSESPSPSMDPEAEGPVAGSGASLSPAKPEAWCGAITPEQLMAATGLEVVEVAARGEGLITCSADLPGVELQIQWGSESTRKSQEQYAASWNRPAGVFEVAGVTLSGGQPATTAIQSSVRNARTGSVTDGLLVEASVTAVGADESISMEKLAAVAEAIVAVYVA